MNAASHRILIVDDNPDWCLTFAGLLKESGLSSQTQSVCTFEDAIAQLEMKEFDLALLDIRLDEGDEDNDAGIKLAKEINHRWPNVKIVFATGYSNESYIEQTMKLLNGKRLAVGFVPKQNIDELVEVVQKALLR